MSTTTTTQPVQTQAQTAQLFARYQKLLRQIAWRFAESHGVDYDTAEADAFYWFMQAIQDHDPDRSDLGQRLQFLVKNRLKDQARAEGRRRDRYSLISHDEYYADNSHLQYNAGVPDEEPDLQEPEEGRYRPSDEFDYDGLTSSLTDDARAVLEIIFESPRELLLAFRSDAEQTKRSRQAKIREYMTGAMGWAAGRVAAAMREIREAIA